jgi:hypothetical protein
MTRKVQCPLLIERGCPAVRTRRQVEAEAGVEWLGGQGDLVSGVDTEALDAGGHLGESTARSASVISHPSVTSSRVVVLMSGMVWKMTRRSAEWRI